MRLGMVARNSRRRDRSGRMFSGPLAGVEGKFNHLCDGAWTRANRPTNYSSHAFPDHPNKLLPDNRGEHRQASSQSASPYAVSCNDRGIICPPVRFFPSFRQMPGALQHGLLLKDNYALRRAKATRSRARGGKEQKGEDHPEHGQMITRNRARLQSRPMSRWWTTGSAPPARRRAASCSATITARPSTS